MAMRWREPAESDLAALSIWIFLRTRLTQQRQVSRSAPWGLYKRKPTNPVVLRTRNQPQSALESELNRSISNTTYTTASAYQHQFNDPSRQLLLLRQRPRRQS